MKVAESANSKQSMLVITAELKKKKAGGRGGGAITCRKLPEAMQSCQLIDIRFLDIITELVFLESPGLY